MTFPDGIWFAHDSLYVADHICSHVKTFNLTGTAKTYMGQIGLSTPTTVTATCLTTPADPTWQVSLQVDFPPALGYMTARGLMPKGTGTTARVKSKLLMRGF